MEDRVIEQALHALSDARYTLSDPPLVRSNFVLVLLEPSAVVDGCVVSSELTLELKSRLAPGAPLPFLVNEPLGDFDAAVARNLEAVRDSGLCLGAGDRPAACDGRVGAVAAVRRPRDGVSLSLYIPLRGFAAPGVWSQPMDTTCDDQRHAPAVAAMESQRRAASELVFRLLRLLRENRPPGLEFSKSSAGITWRTPWAIPSAGLPLLLDGAKSNDWMGLALSVADSVALAVSGVELILAKRERDRYARGEVATLEGADRRFGYAVTSLIVLAVVKVVGIVAGLALQEEDDREDR